MADEVAEMTRRVQRTHVFGDQAHQRSCHDGRLTTGQPAKVWSGYSTQWSSPAFLPYANKGACSHETKP